MIDLRAATADDRPAIEALLDAAFGPGRLLRTAQRLRDGSAPIAGLSLVAQAGNHLAGSIQLWPIELVAPPAAPEPLLLLGPVAVAADARAIGLGRRLIAAALAAADAAGHDAVMLIGDLAYYGRFGFAATATGGWTLPGPVERERLLLRTRGARVLPPVAAVRAGTAATRLAA